MVFEKLPFSFNIQKLKGYLTDTVMSIGDPVYPVKEGFGGWSITSNTGHWADGWKEKGNAVTLPEEYTIPTQLCVGYMKEVLDFIKDKGLTPCKVRVSSLPPNSSSSIHRDYPKSVYRARLHIPLLTNTKCSHIIYNNSLTEKTEFHMPANGSAYMFWVNLRHQYVNMSNDTRYHIVMDVTDTKGITENFKCIMQ